MNKTLHIYQIDAFAEKPFEGNPAAVIPLQEWLSDGIMQKIAEENNLAETAFFVPADDNFHIRWFTPKKEVKLCGHATLASAYVLFNILNYTRDTVVFDSLSGPLSVTMRDSHLLLDFPSQEPARCEAPEHLIAGLGQQPVECHQNEDYIAVFDNEDEIRNITPNHRYLAELDLRGVIITAPSKHYDFVTRFFAPKYGIPEDPVTGSAYTQLTPYWSTRLQKTKLRAKQLSPRDGILLCEQKDCRVIISGTATKYLEGSIEIEI